MYHIYIEGQEIGPLSLEQLKQYKLTLDSRIWRNDLSSWVYVKDLPEVCTALSIKVIEKKPELNAMMFVNIIIQILVTAYLYVMVEEYDMELFGIVCMAIFISCICLYLVSLFMLLQRKYRLAKILGAISCIPFVPIGLIGIFAIAKAIEKVEI